MERGYQEKKSLLYEYIYKLTSQPAALAFSGGVDSALLLRIAAETAMRQGQILYAITADTQLHPSCDAEIAIRVAKQVEEQVRKLADAEAIIFSDDAIRHIVLKLDEFAHADVQDNPVDRCYRCKKYIFTTMKTEMAAKGVTTLMEGTNLDDTRVYRPGIRALRELGVISPLMECGFTKQEVRMLCSEYGLEVASRPSTPCMATRFPYGTRLTQEGLDCVEQAEEILKKYGLYNVRARVHGDVLRIEADPDAMEIFLKRRIEVASAMRRLGYDYVTLDLEGFRSGSMDQKITQL